MISLTKCSVRELYWSFARAEFEITPLGVRHTQPSISSRVLERVLRNQKEKMTDSDWKQLRRAVVSTREDIVVPLTNLRLQWFTAQLPAAMWGNLRVMNLHIFETLAPTRRLEELSAALDRGDFPRIWDPSYYPRLRASFQPSRMHGDPIAIAERVTGPYTLVEGTTRMCALFSMRSRGQTDLSRVTFLLGVSPRVHQFEGF
jgi:hypothetical protein